MNELTEVEINGREGYIECPNCGGSNTNVQQAIINNTYLCPEVMGGCGKRFKLYDKVITDD